MVMIKDNDGIKRYSLVQKEYDLLMRIKEKIREEDQEVWVCFGGNTGTGKSLLSMKWMFPMFMGLTIKQVCFDKPEFINCVMDAKKGTGIICDESISILFSRGSMTKEGRLIAELIAQIRQKNLAIFLNIPEVLSLDWTAQKKLNIYVHVWESRYKLNNKLITYKGNAAVYPELPGDPFKTKIIDYMKKKKANPLLVYKRPNPWITIKGNPIGEGFKKPWYPIDETSYRAKKESILDKYKPGHGIMIDKNLEKRDKAIHLLKERTNITERELATSMGMSKSGIHEILVKKCLK